MRIDSHQHFWRYNSAEHAWISDEMAQLRRDFLPEDLWPLLQGVAFDGCIAVQVRQTLDETNWLLEIAGKHDFILGVVGWIDLRSPDLLSQLEASATHPKLSGVRHIVQDEADDEFMLRSDFLRGISMLEQFDLTYDLLIYPKHLRAAKRLVEKFPGQKFVLDHMAKPGIAEGRLTPWKEDLAELALSPNVFCKLSGMVTEAKWKAWEPEDFRRYLDTVIDAFTPERVMIGSDWPVCTLSADYRATLQVVIDYVQQFPVSIQSAILGETCARFYSASREM